jgi:hypothetical protein
MPGAKPQSSDAMIKIDRPQSRMRRRPRLSARGAGGHQERGERQDVVADDPLHVRELAEQLAGDRGKRQGLSRDWGSKRSGVPPATSSEPEFLDNCRPSRRRVPRIPQSLDTPPTSCICHCIGCETRPISRYGRTIWTAPPSGATISAPRSAQSVAVGDCPKPGGEQSQ